MKKMLSILLAAVMLVSAVPTAFAADMQDYSQGTQVVFEAANNESYTITVPAKLNPGQSGTVTLAGSWPSNKTISVTADPTVTLTNSILVSDQKVLDVTFLGISEAGNDTAAKTYSETVSVEGIENALFGTWSGKFNYFVETSDAVATAGCDTIVWSKNTMGVSTPDNHYAKVSDVELTVDNLINSATFKVYMDGEVIEELTVSANDIEVFDGVISIYEGAFVYAPTDEAFWCTTYPERGLYGVADMPDEAVFSLTIQGYTGFEHSEYCGH